MGVRKKVERSQRKLRNREEFFQDLAIETGFMEVDSVKAVYYALIKMLSRDLRVNNYTVMPDWGHFSLIMHQARQTFDVNAGAVKMLPAKRVVKYEVDWKMKKYFHDLAG